MKEIISEILAKVRVKGSFLRNISYTFVSNIIVFIAGLLFYPLQTAFFSPEAYAQYSMAVLILNNLLVFSRMGYSEALILTKNDQDYFKLMSALTHLSFIVTGISLIAFIGLEDFYWAKFDTEKFSWIYVVFPLVILSGLQNAYGMGNIRFGLLERRAKVNGMMRLMSKVVVIGLGWIGINSGLGLIAGNLFFLLSAMFLLLPFSKIMLFVREFVRFDFKSYKRLLLEHINFPKYVFPALWVILLTQQFPLWFIGLSFDEADLGLYAFAFGVLRVPIDIIDKSVRPVFFKKNIDFKNETEEQVQQSLRKVIKVYYLLLGAYLFFGYWAIEFFYEIIFDEQWYAGKPLMQIIMFGVGITIVSSPMSNVFKVNNKMKLDLSIRVFMLIFLVSLSLIFYQFISGFIEFALMFSIIYFLGYYIFFLFQLREYKFGVKEIISITIKFALIIASCYLLTAYVNNQFLS
ncbi:MAG: oligosaccharide flippase family protein [Cyclobacteriaceae bacterium]